MTSSTWTHCPICGSRLYGGQFPCGHGAKIAPAPDEKVLDQLIEAAKASAYWSVFRDTSQETIDYWKERLDMLRSTLLDAPPEAKTSL